jgi:hypothetical protein
LPWKFDVESGCGDVSSEQRDVADAHDLRLRSTAGGMIGSVSKIGQRRFSETSLGERIFRLGWP